jgi:hypothetical protein
MSGAPHIIAIEPGRDSSSSASDGILELEHVADPASEWDEYPAYAEAEWVAEPRVRWRGALIPTLAGAAAVGWSAFFVWANLPAMMGGAAPSQWVQWIAAWSMPVILCLSIVLLAMRTSRREASRFADIARALHDESARLETRLATVNGELSIAREFVASQSRDLESLGRVAVERLSGNADKLAALVMDNSRQIESIATVSASALENMDKLRGQLPVIANTAKDVTNNIGAAGRTAHAQLQEMVTGFHRLNEFGVASERQVETMREKVGIAIGEFTAQAELLGEIAANRFGSLSAEGAAFRERLDQDEIAALGAVRARAAALAEELATLRAAAESAEAAGQASAAERIAALRSHATEVSREVTHNEDQAIAALGNRLAHLRDEAQRVGSAASEFEGAAAAALAQRLALLREEGASVSAAIASGEAGAIEQWRMHIAALTAEAGESWAAVARLNDEASVAAVARMGEMSAAVEAAHAQIAAQSEELSTQIGSRRAEIEIAGRSAIEALRTRFADIDAMIQAQRDRHVEQTREIAERTDLIGARLASFGETLSTLGTHGDDVRVSLEQALSILGARLGDSRNALAGTDGAIAALTESSIRLLELIRASAEQTGEHLPQALAGAEDKLGGIEQRVFALRDTLSSAGESGRALSDYVLATRSTLGETAAELQGLHGGVEATSREQRLQLTAIREEIAQAKNESEALSASIQETLQGAIDRLSAAAQSTVGALSSSSEQAVAALARDVGERSASAIADAMQGEADAAINRFQSVVADATSASRDAAIQLRDQLAKVDELTGNLERRVAQAREQAEEKVDNDFARRVALITESLNSAAIDIAKALSTDVTDTAWAAYLRGDRGIFTRRAVALLDGAEARAVAQHYDSDHEFRENVRHYIHDFEAMLRNLLSTRDGNALGVTLLSSDMGKLYVALAQGIERLRA